MGSFRAKNCSYRGARHTAVHFAAYGRGRRPRRLYLVLPRRYMRCLVGRNHAVYAPVWVWSIPDVRKESARVRGELSTRLHCTHYVRLLSKRSIVHSRFVRQHRSVLGAVCSCKKRQLECVAIGRASHVTTISRRVLVGQVQGHAHHGTVVERGPQRLLRLKPLIFCLFFRRKSFVC